MCLGGCGNLVLTGFMGSGKTVVGKEVARRLDRRFVDMDTEIEANAQKSIRQIFADDGEQVFRQIETSLCKDLSARRGLVIATGGGALIDASNRALMMKSGTVVCLTSNLDETLRRVSEKSILERPMLNADDLCPEIERLYEERRKAYAAIPWQIDTTGLRIEDVARMVLEMSNIITLSVRCPERILGSSLNDEYPIHIGDGTMAQIGSALRAAGVPAGGRVAVVSNPVVAQLYGERVGAALRSAGLEALFCQMPDGEHNKTLATVSMLYEQFLAGGLDRSGTVLSLGGGVTGDVAGFAAASFMRGVRFAQVPTTLLAIVDASVGGKTGVDLQKGKNLVGAFKQPVAVIIDPTVLETLPVAEIRSGMAEVIKHGVISAPELFAELEARSPESPAADLCSPIPITSSQIARALCVKIEVVEQDPFEQGLRAVLNLGHTVGHALEKLSGYALRHGEAVAIGMTAAAHMASKLGRAEPMLPKRISAVLAAWGLPTRCPPYDIDDIFTAMTHDKKRRGRVLRWVLPTAVGDVEIVEDIPHQVIRAVLSDLGARSSQ